MALFYKGVYMKENYIYIVKVYGMRCGGCEAHVNNLIRKHFNLLKVKSSHFFNKTKIYSGHPLDEEEIKKVIEEDGYQVTSVIKK